MAITADEWTAAHPDGTPVSAWPGTREGHDTPHAGTVRSVAWTSCNSLVAKVTGLAGGIHVAHLECDAKCNVCKRAWSEEQARRKRRDRNARARDRRAAGRDAPIDLDELAQARADFIQYAEHKASCASWESRHDAAPVPCDCGYHEALERAEGR